MKVGDRVTVKLPHEEGLTPGSMLEVIEITEDEARVEELRTGQRFDLKQDDLEKW